MVVHSFFGPSEHIVITIIIQKLIRIKSQMSRSRGQQRLKIIKVAWNPLQSPGRHCCLKWR